jgi:hypothetical protein
VRNRLKGYDGRMSWKKLGKNRIISAKLFPTYPDFADAPKNSFAKL